MSTHRPVPRGNPSRFVGLVAVLSALAPIAFAGVIVSNNFSGDLFPAAGNPSNWSLTATSAGATPAATAVINAQGTIDVRTNTRTASSDPAAPVGVKTSAMTLTANFATSPWNAQLKTGLLKIGANTEAAPAKLNISFDLTTNQIRPITVRIKTWNDASPGAGVPADPNDKYTGEKNATLMPVVTGVPYRYSIDFDTMADIALTPARPSGYNTFNILSNGSGTDGKKIQIAFKLAGTSTDTINWPAGTATISVDNVSITSPSYYVAPVAAGTGTGVDSANPAKLTDVIKIALPGDVICLNGGADYTGGLVVDRISGTPSRWITIRPTDYANPPVIRNTDWSVVSVLANVSYLDVHGITVKGYLKDPAQIAAGLTLANAIEDGEVLNKYPNGVRDPAFNVYQKDPGYNLYTDSPGYVAATYDGCGNLLTPEVNPSNLYGGAGKFNCNGFTLNGRLSREPKLCNPAEFYNRSTTVGEGIHHIRLANNWIYDNTGAGLGVFKGDYIYLEGNIVSRNNKLSRFGGSGITTLTPVDFDGTTGYKHFMVGNISNDNGGDVRWGPSGRIKGGPTDKTITIRYSDGNGIILDTHRGNQYVGRTLLQNNVVYDNGGSGIHTVATDAVDMINNTGYRNGKANTAPASVVDKVWKINGAGLRASPAPYGVYDDITASVSYSLATPTLPQIKKGGDYVNYGEISAHTQSGDIRIVNNLMWARANHKINFDKPTYLSGNVSYINNLFGRDGGDPNGVTAGTSTAPGYQGVYATGFFAFAGNVTVTDTTPVNVFSNYAAPADSITYPATYLHLNTTASGKAGNLGVGVNVGGQPGVPGEDRVNVWRPKNGTGQVDIGAYEDK